MLKKFLSWSLALAICSLVLVPALHFRADASTVNLIANPSAETANTAGQPTNWQGDHWGTSSASFSYQNSSHTGNKSLYAALTSAGSGDAKWSMDSVAVNPNTSYNFTDYYMANVTTEVDMAFTDAAGNTSYAYALSLPAASSWTAANTSFVTPANAVTAAVVHIVYSVGWLQTDDYTLIGPATPPPPPPPVASGVVSANPADYTPQIPLGSSDAIYAYAQVGDTMYSGGSFALLGNASRSNIGAFSATTGALSIFAPTVNGPIWSITPLPNGQLAIGGDFSSVNGVARRGLAVVDGQTGAVNTAFNAQLSGMVYDAKLVNGQLIIGGEFTKRLQAVNPTTGADTGYINLAVSGTRVSRFAVNAQGTSLVAVGKFDSVSGQARRQAFMVNLGSTAASLSSWYYQPLLKQCSITTDAAYIRGVAFSPDGSYFVLDGTGYTSKAGDLGSTICDAAARFETATLAPSKPTWINYTGGDSLYSVAISSTAIYVGGHNRWLNNPYGSDTCGVGCVARPGIGAIDPVSGKALSWDPQRTRGIGAKALYLTPAGLWVGFDTGYGGKLGCSNPGGSNHDDCAGLPLENHAGIGFMPLP